MPVVRLAAVMYWNICPSILKSQSCTTTRTFTRKVSTDIAPRSRSVYYNPNITPETEYIKRVKELKRFIREVGYENDVTFVEGTYDPQVFFDMAKGMEDLPERGLRCYHCYALRMEEAAKKGADYFTTTLSISPHKNAQWINEIGEKLADQYGVKHLPSDFKKKGGYLRSIALSEEYHLYRQNYCGCVFSKKNPDL